MSTIVELKNASLVFKVKHPLGKQEIKALWRANVSVSNGEVIGVVGKNGAGKTSLLRVMAGRLPVQGGVRVASPNVRFALLSINPGFQGELSGRENCRLILSWFGKSRTEAQKIEETVRSFSDLGPFFDLPVKVYSSGMVARLGFSLFITAPPDVLIIDEVLSVGDATFQDKSSEVLRNLLMQKDRTAIIVSHNTKFLQEFCSRCLVLDRGEIVYDGLPGEAIDYYESM